MWLWQESETGWGLEKVLNAVADRNICHFHKSAHGVTNNNATDGEDILEELISKLISFDK